MNSLSGFKWMAKPPPGTPLVTDHPLLKGLILCADFLEGAGARTYDNGPLRAQTFQGPFVTAAQAGYTTSTAASVFSGWSLSDAGPSIKIVSTDTLTPSQVTQASCVDFRLPHPLVYYWPDTTAPVTFICEFMPQIVSTATQAAQMFCMGDRDGVNGAWIPYCGPEQGALGVATFGNNGTEMIVQNAAKWVPTTNAWNVFACASSANSRTMVLNRVVGTNTQATGGVQSHDGDVISIGAGWINAGQLSMDGGTSSGWDGLMRRVRIWNYRLPDQMLFDAINDPNQIYAMPTSKRWFPMSSSTPTPTPTPTWTGWYTDSGMCGGTAGHGLGGI